MNKFFRLAIVLTAMGMGVSFLIPTYIWYFQKHDETLRAQAVQPRELIGQQARDQALIDVDKLMKLAQADALLSEELFYFISHAEGAYKRAKLALPTIWSARDVIRFTLTREELVEFSTSFHSDHVLALKSNKDRAFRLGLDLAGGLSATLQADFAPLREKLGEEPNATQINDAMMSALDAVRGRADRFGATEPIIRRQGIEQILVELPGEQDVDAIHRLVMGQGSLAFHMVDQTLTSNFNQFIDQNPEAIRLLDRATGRFLDTNVVPENFVVRPYYIKDRFGADVFREYVVLHQIAGLDGQHIKDVRVSSDNFGAPTVNFSLDIEGARIFANLTAANVNRPLAVVMDGRVKSVATINSAITGGSVMVNGFNALEAQNLSMTLKSSGLPIGLVVVNIQSVGPTLGAETIQAGLRALVIGFGLVVSFFMLYYQGAGVQTFVTLSVNLFLTLALLSSVGFTLTLTSMAGLVLNLGMAVDANVLIFERIKEELRQGRSRAQAIDLGFKKAFSAILDSNITTFIVAIFLSQMGSGAIKGFAITLAVGILTNLFTAVYFSRLLFDIGTDWFKVKKISIGWGVK
jgi:preprotein translocase subunit SecD